jgi:tRNA(fMet)-specific endonuclease VapC
LKYSLDTNFCIRYLKGIVPTVLERLNARMPHEVVICSIVRAELLFGAIRSDNPARAFVMRRAFLSPYQTLPFDDAAAEHCARIRFDLEKRGVVIGPNDLMIAAIAVANDLTLVTHNTGEFARVPGLKIEDWEN